MVQQHKYLVRLNVLEQLYTRRKPCWCSQPCCSRNMFFGVMNHASLSGHLLDKPGFDRCQLHAIYWNTYCCVYCKDWWMVWGYYLGFGQGLFSPVMGLLNATGYEDILANLVLLALWQQFGEVPAWLCPCAQSKVLKVVEVWCGGTRLACTKPWPQLHLWEELERKLLARTSRPTSVPDLTNGLLAIWAQIPSYWQNSILVLMVLEWDVQKAHTGVMLRCQLDFVHMV